MYNIRNENGTANTAVEEIRKMKKKKNPSYSPRMIIRENKNDKHHVSKISSALRLLR